MKKKLHMISSVICIVMLCVALCFAFAGCSKTSVQLQNELGALLEGGGFEKGSSLVTDLIETAGEKGQEIISLLEGQNYDKDGEVSIYDIFVAKDGKEVQPNEKVKITLPAPFESESGYITFHIRSNNIVEALKTVYENGNISFETDSFSTFVVTSKDPEATAAKSTLRILFSGDGGNLDVLVNGVNGVNRSIDSMFYENQIECDIYSDIMLWANIFSPETHDFIGWYRNYESEETFITDSLAYNFLMAEEEVTIIGVIREKSQPSYCSVSVSMEGSGGSINCDSYHISNLGSDYRTSVARGEIMILSAFPSSGVEFDGWYVNGERVSTKLSHSLRVEENDVKVVAKFNDLRKTLKISQTGQGSTSVVKVNYDPHQMTSGPDSTASVKYTEGSIIKLTATRDPDVSNCKFIGWYLVTGDDQVLLSEEKEFEITLTEDTSIIAVFKNIYQFEANTSDSSLGKISFNGNDDIGLLLRAIPEGGSITLKAVPKNGGIFEGWYLVKGQSEEFISKDEEYTFGNIREDMNILAKFSAEPVTYKTLRVEQNGKGTTSLAYGSGNPIEITSTTRNTYTRSFAKYTTVKLTATRDPNESNCKFIGWYLVTGDDQVLLSEEKEFEITLTEDTSIIAVFKNIYQFEANTSDSSLGKISFNGNDDIGLLLRAIPEGGSITLKAVPKNGGIFEGWYLVKGQSEEFISKDEEYTFGNIREGMKVIARFRKSAVYSLTVTTNDANLGCIKHSESGAVSKYTADLTEGETLTLKAVANEGCTFDGWYLVKSNGSLELISKNAEYTFVMGSSDMEVKAIFTESSATLRVTQRGNGGGTTISFNGGNYPCTNTDGHVSSSPLKVGTQITLTANVRSSDSYEFVGWYSTSGTTETLITADESYTFTLNGDESILAVFRDKVVTPTTYTFSAFVSGEGDIWYSGSVCEDKAYTAELAAGSTITLKAVASNGYKFDGWYVDEVVAMGALISTSEEYTFTMESADKRVMAKFVEDTTQTTDKYIFSATVGSEGGMIHYNGVAQPNGYFAELPAGSTVTLTAVPDNGYRFEGWYVDDVVAIGALISTDATYTFTVGSENMRVVARFAGIPTYTFQALVGSDGGMIYYDGSAQPNGYYDKVTEGSKITLTAEHSDGFRFAGWYEPDGTDAPTLVLKQTPVSTSATYEFTMPAADYTVYAVFEAKVTALLLDGVNAGFREGEATYTIGDEYKPNPENVIVSGVKVTGNEVLTKDADYTIDLGGLDFAQAGTYTITYTYVEDTSMKATLTVIVEQAEELLTYNLAYMGLVEDSGEYNGGRALYVYKSNFTNNGEVCDIEDIGLSYEWRDHITKQVVEAARDDTWDSTSAHYPSPAVVGTYDFVVYKEEDGNKVDLLTLVRTIEVNKFELDDGTSGLGEYTNYTFIAQVGNDYYALPNLYTLGGNSEREAIKLTPDENGIFSLGENYECVFRPYDSYKTAYNGLTQYRLRTGMGLNRTGNLILWETGGIEYNTATSADYTVTISINDDGTVTVHAPFCGGTLRLVYDETTGNYLFTAKKAENDTRTSYPVYLYGEYTEPVEETKETYEFYGKLSKEYDGNAVSFNVYKEVNIFTENGEDASAALKNGTGKFVWTDAKGNVISVGTPNENGDVAGPSAIGSYRLVFQTLQKGENGMEWAEKAVLHCFEITDPNEIN